MVSFKSWKDMYLFLKKYHNFSCLQCKYYHSDLSDEEMYTDSEYARFFCPYHLSMVRLDFQQSCPNWTSKDGVKLTDMDQDLPVFKFNNRVLDTLDDMQYVSINDIDKIVEEVR